MKLENRRHKQLLQQTDEKFVFKDNTLDVIKSKDGNIDLIFNAPDYENVKLKLTKTNILQNKPIDKEAVEIISSDNVILDFEDTNILYINMMNNIIVDDITNIFDNVEYHLYLKQGDDTTYTFEFDDSLNLVFDGEFSYDNTLDSVTHITLIRLGDEIYVKSHYKYEEGEVYVKLNTNNQYIFHIDTTLGNNTKYKLNLNNQQSHNCKYNFIVDWGDGNKNHVTQYWVNSEHTYEKHGEYVITLTGLVEGFGSFSTDNYKITHIEFKNKGELKYLWQGFYDTINLKSFTTKYDEWGDDLQDVTSLFRGCKSLTDVYVSNWNLPNVKSTEALFFDCTSLKSIDITTLNTLNLTNMSYMFQNCKSIEEIDVSNWNLTNFSSNFKQVFNDCESLKYLHVDDWNVKDMLAENRFFQFFNCTSLRNLNVTKWDVSLATNLNLFWNTSAIAHNYDDVLNAWSKQDVQYGVYFNAGLAKYTIKGVEARNYLINEKGWSIQDLGIVDEYTPFEFTIDTTKGDEASFKLPLPLFEMEFIEQNNYHQESRKHLKYNFFVDWGDGTSNIITQHDVLAINHIYDAHGQYNIKIQGLCEGWRFVNNKGEIINNDNVKIVYVNNLGYTGIKDTFGMFAQNVNLTQINNIDYVNDWSKNATDFSYLFYNCQGLSGVDTNNLVTSNIKYLKSTFQNNYNNATITTTNWNVTNVRFFNYTFNYCYQLSSLNTSNWSVENIINTSHMFDMCPSFSGDIDFSDWNTSNLIDTSHMFEKTYGVGNINLSDWDTSNLKYVNNMFQNCAVKELYMNNWDTSGVIDMNNILKDTYKLKKLEMVNWDIHNVHDLLYLQKYSLEYLDVTNTKINKITDLTAFFEGHTRLHTILGLNGWDLSSVTSTERMFNRCSSLSELDLNNWNTLNVENMFGMFMGCSSLDELNIDSWDVSNVTNMGNMFAGTILLINVDISEWNISNVNNMISMLPSSKAIAHNYDDVLNKWATLDVQENVEFNAGLAKYSDVGEEARSYLIDVKGWTITDKGGI